MCYTYQYVLYVSICVTRTNMFYTYQYVLYVPICVNINSLKAYAPPLP